MKIDMWREIQRKLFHLLGVLYIVGVIWIPRPRFLLIITSLLIVEFSFELLRIKNPWVNQWVCSTFRPLLREEEQAHFSGVFWMMAGVLATALLIDPVPVVVTVLLYLILGDSLASLVGKRWGGPTWPGSEKRVSGSLACFAVCLIVGVAILRPAYNWNGVIVGALTATFLELKTTRLNDNFVIPMGSSVVMMACYGLKPLFF